MNAYCIDLRAIDHDGAECFIGLPDRAELTASFYEKVNRLAVEVPEHLVKKSGSFERNGTSSPFYPVHSLTCTLILQLSAQNETKAKCLKILWLI